jgi:hypothetical protein
MDDSKLLQLKVQESKLKGFKIQGYVKSHGSSRV